MTGHQKIALELANERITLAEALAQAWEQGWQAAREVVSHDGMKLWAHTVMPEGYEGNPYEGGDA